MLSASRLNPPSMPRAGVATDRIGAWLRSDTLPFSSTDPFFVHRLHRNTVEQAVAELCSVESWGPERDDAVSRPAWQAGVRLWGFLDPGLDETDSPRPCRTARELASLPHPLPVYSSPLRRCRETGLPLAELWGVQPIIFPEVGEVPSPPLSLEQRQEWLRAAMKSDWAFMQSSAPADAPDYGLWRTTLLDALRAMSGDVVIFSHFIAINAVIGAALGNEQVINFRPDHASITTVEVASGNFR